MFIWEKLDKCGERIITDFRSDVFKLFSGYMPSGMLPPRAMTKLLKISLVATNCFPVYFIH